jgi:hypothetical protein
MPDIFDQVAAPSKGDIFDQVAPEQTPEQAAALRLTRGLISDRGLRPGPPQLEMKESIAPKLVRNTVNTVLPALGGLGGGLAAAPTVVGAAAGAGLGTAAGEEAAQLTNRAIFGESDEDPNPASLTGLKRMGILSGEAALTAGGMAGLSGAPLTMPKPAPAMQVLGPEEIHQELNDAIGAKANSIRIGRGAQSMDEAATNPGRGLANEGFEASELKNMTPVERMAAIKPKLDAAGKAIDDVISKATDAGKVVDVGNTATETLGKIADPKLQEKAIDTFNSLAKEIGITNQRAATPEQALQLRRALGGGARFGPSGDLSSLAGVRAGLYRSVNSDLRDVVPTLGALDQHYSDLNGAIGAVQSQVGKAAVTAPAPLPAGPAPGPGLLKQGARIIGPHLVRQGLRYAGPTIGGGIAANSLYDWIRSKF